MTHNILPVFDLSLIPNWSVHKRHHKIAMSSVFCKNVQGDSVGNVNILGGDSIDHFDKWNF
jgi:hypothetical protein